MGDRFTRSAPAGDVLRAKGLRHAPSRGGTASAFIPPLAAKPAPAALSWNFPEVNPNVVNAENPLDMRRQFLEQVFENSPDALVIADLSLRVQCVNPEFERMFGYTAAQALGQRIDTLVLPPDRAAEAHWMEQSLQRGEQIAIDTRRIHQNGAQMEVAIFTAPLLVNGRPAAYYFIYRNISDRKRAEDLSSALYRIAEKSSAAQDLQQFFAAIHNILDELMFARNFSVAIHDPESQLLSFHYFVDERESIPLPAKPGRGLVDHVLCTGESLLCTPQLAQKMKKRGEIDFAGELPRQWLGVPLKVNQHVFGVLILKSY